MLEKLNKKTIKLKITKETLENLRRIFDLKGEGIKESPIIFKGRDLVRILLT